MRRGTIADAGARLDLLDEVSAPAGIARQIGREGQIRGIDRSNWFGRKARYGQIYEHDVAEHATDEFAQLNNIRRRLLNRERQGDSSKQQTADALANHKRISNAGQQ